MPKADTISLKLDPKLRAALEKLAAEKGVALTDLITLALGEHVLRAFPKSVLRQAEKKKPLRVSIRKRTPKKQP